ncbi:GNAT family N-acetyltransferase [Maricaulaceae bacterium MS644]
MSEAVPVLKTKRLILRAFTAADFDAFAAIWGDASVVRHISGTPSSRSDSWSRLLRLAGSWPLLGYGYWAVEERATGRLTGMAGLADFKREIGADIAGLPEAGWVFSPEFHGKGYATEAMRAALCWADAALDAEKSCCLIHPNNAASINVAQKLGYGGRITAPFGEGETLVFFRPRGGSDA